MLKRLFSALLIHGLSSGAYSQQPEKVLSQWSALNPIEKAYLHFDRNDYIAGQTIWFKAYLYSDFLPDDKSTMLYVELLNLSSSVISRQVFPVSAGFSRGQIELADSLPGGSYVVRAYTPTMLNHDHGLLYSKNFYIFGKENTDAVPAVRQPAVVRMEFFPEGGNLVTGLSNSVAFKATDPEGLPVHVSGVIKKGTGEVVTTFSAYHDGMGYFDITPAAADSCYAVLNGDAPSQKYYLPASTPKGVVLRIISNGKTKTYEILQRNDNPVFRAAYMIGQMQHHPVFRKDFKDDKDEITGMIQTDNLSSGIMHITVFNKDGMPLAERLTFVDNKEYMLPGNIIVDTLDFSDRGKNHFTLAFNDTVKGSFSVSVTDPAFNLLPARQENIFSGLLLTSDLRGYIHNPAYYFSGQPADSVQNALDLVMMTSGWRRFRWKELLKAPLPANPNTDPGYIALKGRIQFDATKKPFAGRELLAIIIPSDKSKNMQLFQTDKEGRFRVDSIVFFGPASIVFSDIRGKKSKFIEVRLDADSLHKTYKLPEIHSDGLQPRIITGGATKKIQEAYEAAMSARGIMLEGVTVTANKKSKQQQFEEKYISPLFSGDATRKIDLQEEDLTAYQNIFDYLRSRVPGLTVIEPNYENTGIPQDITDDGASYRIFFRQGPSVSSLGNIPATLYLDEIETPASVIAAMPANQIAYVKIFSSFVAASGGGAGGALAIYTKRGDDLLAVLPSAGDILGYNGFSVIREFYSPDYSVKKAAVKTDYRTTLYWNPAVYVSGVNAKVPLIFYNNDRTGQFKIIVEGMSVDGKILMIEKTIGARKAF